MFLLDESRSGTARWCSMATCGNRLKARRHNARGKGALGLRNRREGACHHGAVTLPGRPPPPQTRRRWWLIAVVAAWIVAVAVLGWWSVRNDPPTVPEQRDIADALPVLERATGAMFAAATAEDRAVVLGELRVSRDCTVTPVRGGVEGSRDVTVYVQAGQALTALHEIAAALPADFRAESGGSSGGRRIGLHSRRRRVRGDRHGLRLRDPGVSGAGVDRMPAAGREREPGPNCRPRRRRRTYCGRRSRRWGAIDEVAAVQEIACPDGGVGRTYTVDGVPAPRDLGRSLQPVVKGATVVRAEPAGWALPQGRRVRGDPEERRLAHGSAPPPPAPERAFSQAFTCVNRCLTIL